MCEVVLDVALPRWLLGGFLIELVLPLSLLYDRDVPLICMITETPRAQVDETLLWVLQSPDTFDVSASRWSG